MDRLQAMQTFVRVVEAGGFSAVARERNTSQSVVSKQVAALEQYLGVTLLIRTTRSLALTDAGERYFEQARRLVAEVSEAESLLRHSEQQLSGLLRVAAPVGFGLRVLMPHVQQFLLRHPGVRIDLRLNDNLIDLVEQGVDVTLRIGLLTDSGLVARRVGTTYGAVVASRAYVERLDSLALPQVPEDLLRHPCIVYTELTTRNVWSFSNSDGHQVTVSVQGPLQSNSSEAVRAAVLAGMGISRVPTWMFQDELRDGRVQIFLTDWQVNALPVHLVSPLHRRQSVKVKVFSDFIAEALAE